MAKFAEVTYGTKGQSKRYTYVVNDNVRTGDFLHPTVKHSRSGKLYATTGIVQKLNKTTSKQGQEKSALLEAKGVEAEEALTSRDIGAKRLRDKSGAFQRDGGMGKTIKDPVTGDFVAQKDFERGQSLVGQTRLGNVAARKAKEFATPVEKRYENFVSEKGVAPMDAAKQAVSRYQEYANQFTSREVMK